MFRLLLQFPGSYYSRIWISTPPLLTEDTSLTVYFCSGKLFFYNRNSNAYMRGVIREAGTPTYRKYTGLLFFCNGRDQCRDLYQQNFTNSLVTLYTFTHLKPNTLYSLEFLGCYRCCCHVSWRGSFHHSVNIATRPEGQ